MQDATWSFVAMEYYALILNRTYLVTVTEDRLEAAVCRGVTSVAIKRVDVFYEYFNKRFAVSGDLHDPRSYVDQGLLKRPNRANFSILLNRISSVEYNANKKWGMGYYPHDGRVLIGSGKRIRELIVMGRQSGAEISRRLSVAIARSGRSPQPLSFTTSA